MTAGSGPLSVVAGDAAAAARGEPVPLVPTASTNASPPAMLLLPVATSDAEALTVTAVLLDAGGVSVTPLVVGPVLSMVRVVVPVGPQFPAASLAWT